MSSELVGHVRELLAPLGAVRARRMFGGWGFYVDGVFLALMADGRLFLKADAVSQHRFEACGCEPFVFESPRGAVRMSYWSAPHEAMESPALMLPWSRLALEAALRARAPTAARSSTAANHAQPAVRPASQRARTPGGRHG